MPSLIPGYEYDIFISYRHKDNRYDGWVTEFVANLKKELDSTFKEELSIYFDQNLNDGLHETSDVDDTIQNKIKCLVFIPILSRTYCDPTSFAWTKEFSAFCEFARKDRHGLKIKGPNGNVSSRILPIKTHELECEDASLFENAIGGTIRSVDFVFRSSGVNRPLRANEDHPSENQHHIFYRDQINKVANAIDVIIASMKQTVQTPPATTISPTNNQYKRNNTRRYKFVVAILSILLLCSAAFDLSNYFGGVKAEEELMINRSIAVLPFEDLSAGKDQEFLCEELTEELLNLLADIRDLKVIAHTFAFKGKRGDIRVVNDKVDVGYLLQGSVRTCEGRVRITVRLIDAHDGSHVWSETFKQSGDEVLSIQDVVSEHVVRELQVRLSRKTVVALLNK